MAINCGATYGRGGPRDVSFNTPGPRGFVRGGLFLKGAKTYCEQVLISVRRHSVWDHWDLGHEGAIIFSPAASLCEQITQSKKN